MKVPIKIFKSRSPYAGFTLIELLVAASITTIVVTLAGSGVVAMLQSSNKAQSENLRRVELNRALDFINEEVRMAKSIATDASANLTTVAPDFKSSGTPILTLEIPGVSERVIYYLEDASSPWLGPKVIYRWGPTFGDNGNYKDPKTPNQWQGRLLVDFIADTKPYSNTPCSAIPTNWSANPSSANGQGFSACVQPYANNEPSGKIAKIQLRGQLTDGYGNPTKDPLIVSTHTFARASDPLSFTTSGGTVTITQSSTADFKVLGGDTSFYYGGTKYEIPTFIDINVTPNAGTPYINNKISPSNTTPVKVGSSTNEPTLTTGTTLTVTGRSPKSYSIYGGFDANSETNKDTQVWTLRDGDTLPPFTPYPGQVPPANYLTKDGYLENGKIKLAANQVIYLFEVTSTDKKRNDYDMQDIIVLATITPK